MRSFRGHVWGLAIWCLIGVQAQANVVEEELRAQVGNAWGGVWEPVNQQEFDAAKQLFVQILKADNVEAFRQQATSLGLEWVVLADPDLIVLRESEGLRRGRGVFVLRTREFEPVILQAPHARADRFTGDIASRWMAQLPFQILAVNTVHRRSGASSDTADLARQERSYFTALVEAAGVVYAHPQIRQIHGFARANRKTNAGRQADAILSSGSRDPRPPVLSVSTCLDPLIDQVLTFGVDVEELGATINPVSRWYLAKNLPGFVHVEFELNVREKLINNREILSETGLCLLQR